MTDDAGFALARGPRRARGDILSTAYERIISRIGLASSQTIAAEADMSPHPQLRRVLQSDPAMAALLPLAPSCLVPGFPADSPFFLTRTGLLRVPSHLLSYPAALAAAVRWGIEAAYLQAEGLLDFETAAGVLFHGRSLLRAASQATRDLVLDGLPPRVIGELLAAEPPSQTLLAWQRSRVESLADPSPPSHADPIAAGELWLCVEDLLQAGGDTRLIVDRRTGFNRYGATPRPRPEAVHFSSSTASSISDYGFTYCEKLRRDLIGVMIREKTAAARLRSRAVDAISGELLALLGLGPSEADVTLAPSGTDTETLAVLLAIARDRPVTNILIAPEETGRGVRAAAAGCFFDTQAASGDGVEKGASAWPAARIAVVEIPIREVDGAPRQSSKIEDDVRAATAVALSSGHRVLLHLLASSKTGLTAPRERAIEEMLGAYPGSVDVVVDACQMRTPFEAIGAWVRKGWMVQISGSKFLTGPPFSGALALPAAYRERARSVGALLAGAPLVGAFGDWSSYWRESFPLPDKVASFGPIFRWLPALLEAELFNHAPLALRRESFERFRAALNARLDESEWLVRLDESEILQGAPPSLNLATRSIMCFTVLVARLDGTKRRLDEAECRKIFDLLNLDLSDALGPLGPREAATAQLQAHIGQPVSLRAQPGSASLAVLRMVLGARFFGIVAHSGAGSAEAALQSEIADAIRALEKLELLARSWPKIEEMAATAP